MKTIFKLFCFMFCVMLIFGFGYLCGSGKQARHYPAPFKTVTKQMKSIQQQVGCKKIDAVIGPETTLLVNAKIKEEERELCNKYAIESMNRMAKRERMD